jgi:hypothetical protein
MGGTYLFAFKVEVVDAFDSKIAASRRAQTIHHRGHRERRMGCALGTETEKPAGGRLFCFYSISSEYHAGGINRPNIIEGIKV